MAKPHGSSYLTPTPALFLPRDLYIGLRVNIAGGSGKPAHDTLG